MSLQIALGESQIENLTRRPIPFRRFVDAIAESREAILYLAFLRLEGRTIQEIQFSDNPEAWSAERRKTDARQALVWQLLRPADDAFDPEVHRSDEFALAVYAMAIQEAPLEFDPFCEDADIAIEYALFFDTELQNAEALFSNNPEYAYAYALNVLQGRWEKAEPALARSDRFSRLYGENILDYSPKGSDEGGALLQFNILRGGVGRQDIQIRRTKELASLYQSESVPAEARGILMRLDRMIGLDRVKKEVANIAALSVMRSMRATAGLRVPPTSLHLVFTGNPGTGKTTIARHIGKLYKAFGMLQSGHVVEVGRPDLVAEYIGQTGPKTQEKLEEALDGVLFIDEAYSLSGRNQSKNDFGPEAIETILTFMENNRDRIAIIAAGYSTEMTSFVDSNPGLQSRFTRYIHFEDYSSDDLFEILCGMAEENEYLVSPDAEESVKRVFSAERDSREGRSFGNARFARTLFEKAVENHALRIPVSDDIDQLMLLKTEDFVF